MRHSEVTLRLPANLDCVIVGHNEVDFHSFTERQRQKAKRSGAYMDLVFNSVRLDGERMNYMTLLSRAVAKATGHDPELCAFELPSLGACQLASFLRRRGLSCEIVNLFNKERHRFEDLLGDSPASVAITTTYYVDPQPIIEIVRFVRERAPEAVIVVGGPFVHGASSSNSQRVQDQLFRMIGADVYITESQGELTLSRVVERVAARRDAELDDVPNLTYTSDGKTFQRTRREVEDIPLAGNGVDWSGFPQSLYVPTTYVRSARSCPFSCAFCNYPSMSGNHQFLGVPELEKEFIGLYEAGVRNLIFIDDTFNVPLPRFKKILRMMIENRLDFRWVSFFRCSNADEEAFDLMKQSGCMGVYLGIESGDSSILEKMRKFAKLQGYRDGIRRLTEREILTYGSFIVGFPGETARSVDNTIQFIQENPTTFYNLLLYFHDTMAPVHERASEFGLHGSQYKWRHDTMDWQEAVDHTERMFRSIDASTPCPLHGFAIWAFPYLVECGFEIDQIRRFVAGAKGMLIGSFDDAGRDFSHEMELITSIFCTS